jgi:hypothetical protein
VSSANDTCDVCRFRKAKGVYASGVAPVTLAYCETCLQQHREPYEFLIIHLRGQFNNLDEFPLYYHPIIEGTLKAENKTQSQFLQDCAEMERRRSKLLDVD